jgi:hypothetical protein
MAGTHRRLLANDVLADRERRASTPRSSTHGWSANPAGAPSRFSRDFDSELLRQRGIAVVTPPQLVEQLVADEPSVVALAVRAMAEIRYMFWSIDARDAATRTTLQTISG